MNGIQYATHNYPGAGSTHSYGLCGRHGASGVFAERNGALNEAGTYLVHPNIKLKNIVDGLSNTACFSEFGQNLRTCPPDYYEDGQTETGGWGRPMWGATAYSIRREQTPNACYGANTGTRRGAARSWHEGGVHVAFLDGRVSFVSENIEGNTWMYIHRFDDGRALDIDF